MATEVARIKKVPIDDVLAASRSNVAKIYRYIRSPCSLEILVFASRESVG